VREVRGDTRQRNTTEETTEEVTMTEAIASDHEAVGGTVVGGVDYIERAVAALDALAGKARQLAQAGKARELRRIAAQAPDVLTEQCDEIEELTEFVTVRLRALADEAKAKQR
jgi:DNA-binding PucR family transcriptional regulator